MRPIMLIVCLWLVLAAPVRAQTTDPQDVNVHEVWKSLAEEPGVEDARRAQVTRVLDHPVTREVARDYQLDLDAALRAVPVLEGSELQQLAERAAGVEKSLAGGDSKVVISTTVIIIVLLVLILVLVAD